LNKLNENEDSKLMSENYYKKQDVVGDKIMNNELSLNKLKEEKTNKMTLKSFSSNNVIQEAETIENIEKEFEEILRRK
jgi:hypothetical protein